MHAHEATTPPLKLTMPPIPTARPSPTAPAVAAPPPAALARRSALAFAAALVARPAAAAIGVWDGKSSALGSCPVGAAGDGCRSSLLAADVAKGVKLGGASAGASAPLASGATTAAKLDGPYAAETRALAAYMKAYLALAADDPQRVPAGRKVRGLGGVGGGRRVLIESSSFPTIPFPLSVACRRFGLGVPLRARRVRACDFGASVLHCGRRFGGPPGSQRRGALPARQGAQAHRQPG